MHIRDDRTKSRNSREENNQCNPEIVSTRLGSLTGEGQNIGDEQNQVSDSYCAWRNSVRPENYGGGQGTIGKILESLKLIKQEHQSYVRSHQERLETRLTESKEREDAFNRAVKELEQEIYNLISNRESTQDSE